MDRFLELCVQLKKGRQAKDGLYLFKNVAQNTSAGHVDAVIKKFLDLSKAKLQEAISKVDELEGPLPSAPTPAPEGSAEDQAAIPQAEADVEDLEASETPESILLSAVSEEKSRDRTYRTVVMPWLRFLWEAYRTSLDTLRNNARLEEFYQVCTNQIFPLPVLLSSSYFTLSALLVKLSTSAALTSARLSSVVSAKCCAPTWPAAFDTLSEAMPSTSPSLKSFNATWTLASSSSTPL